MTACPPHGHRHKGFCGRKEQAIAAALATNLIRAGLCRRAFIDSQKQKQHWSPLLIAADFCLLLLRFHIAESP